MWNDEKRQRFQELRRRENQLTEVEQAELAYLIQELEGAESGYLGGATERTRRERETVEKVNRSLETLAARRKNLLQRLTDFLSEARAERHAIEKELASVFASERRSDGNE